MPPSLPILWRVKRWYVRFMLAFIGHGLAMACRTDRLIQKEIAALPDDFTFSMRVMPRGPALSMKKSEGRIKLRRKNGSSRPDVDIQFKHLAHAYHTLSFQEGTTEAFARERMVVDGDLPSSMKLVRCFERLEVITLPRFIGRNIMRHYPDISLKEKLVGALKIYLGVLAGFVMGVFAK
ncbi:hypothetical protein [Endozoicomonas sp. SCSIO W0465]|uniref:hypothetical protein n=1 Tax=Endozoicomonas sp. SCSIO W0465 TaxID=2918516 RepID=UPI002074CD28|nr:hypothetical protein [Endozoicomonas sp. SCSIO W0465]USE36362.1 hypothetical protein MJO57_30790 [Endozoicomonas sp. SCSIO W0465]